jgi:site-specific DNA-methyltransferase (adenine-specific)
MLICGNNLQELPKLPDNSIDSIVTDPPYELGFMGKTWDSTGIAYNTEVWQQCLRVLKPGGHLLAFGGSRTYHRLACAIEDAGFQIRDQIMWVYGSGFPKSLNISKAIDKAAGAEREVVGQHSSPATSLGNGKTMDGGAAAAVVNITAPSTDAAKQWQGWGTALKPAHEPIVLARKPLDGTVANNVLTHGTGGINIDGCRVHRAEDDVSIAGHRTVTFGTQETSSGGDGSGGWSQNDAGRFPANFIHDGSDEVLELFPDTAAGKRQLMRRGATTGRSIGGDNCYGTAEPYDAMTGYDDSGSAARFFYCAKANKTDRNEGLDDFAPKRDADRLATDGAGGENPRNRTNTAKVNHHPTVKPTTLMRYLIRLITPPHGTILDPFTGSGSTGKAAVLEGFNFIGIELDPDYIAIAEARIQHAYNQHH